MLTAEHNIQPPAPFVNGFWIEENVNVSLKHKVEIAIKTSNFAQYEHLEYLNPLMALDKRLAASMGNDYIVAPDVVIYRETVSDNEINSVEFIVDDSISTMADLRRKKEVCLYYMLQYLPNGLCEVIVPRTAVHWRAYARSNRIAGSWNR